MALSEPQAREFMRRLLFSRMRLLNHHPFFGLLLMHMKYGIDEDAPTAYTDGERIVFGPEFLESLSDSELDFIMMHEIMHVVLQHCMRGKDFDQQERFNIACDIVVNSNILLENNMDVSSINIQGAGVSMHLAPDGSEGYEHTAEKVYEMLPDMPKRGQSMPLSGNLGGRGGGTQKGQGAEQQRATSSSSETVDDHSHLGDLGGSGSGTQKGRGAEQQCASSSSSKTVDDHSHWGDLEEDDTLRDAWVQRANNAAKAIEIREQTISRGLLPMLAKRLLHDLRAPQTDWRQILQEFAQQEVCDYSFSPPDRRMDESPFFLPDFNELQDTPQKILFMIDTSGSMSDEMITVAFSEVKGAVDQFNGALEGWLGFFDAAIVEPIEFNDVDELLRIKPMGGGGTDFQIIFEYIAQHMETEPPACIIILTDGYAPFPQEHLANGIPVLWLLNNDKVKPPWGKVARVQV